jgi:hypothetical protein
LTCYYENDNNKQINKQIREKKPYTILKNEKKYVLKVKFPIIKKFEKIIVKVSNQAMASILFLMV